MGMLGDYNFLENVSIIFGWLYFLLWSISFYPQLISNLRRRSVTGLSVDFVIASFYGFLCYAIFNSGMYFIESVREEYRQRNNGQNNLVALNDVIFAVHAAAVTFLFCVQVLMYRKTGEGPSNIGLALAGILTVIITVGLFMSFGQLVRTLDYLYALSYVKLILTVVKCMPQVWLNWVRRSTIGWSIANVLLDFFGGFFSISQLFMDAFLSGHNLGGILGVLPKFILGIISITFDIIFMLQHYVWFPEGAGPHTSTIISPPEELEAKARSSMDAR